jgi:hypothetical protein
MTITGGYKTVGDDDKYRLLDQTSANIGKNNNPGLPTGKKDFRLVDVEIKYPNAEKYPRFAGYKNYSYKNTFKTDAPMA